MKIFKKLGNNLAYIIIGLILAIAGTAYAINVSVPAATQKGDLPSGLITGNYQLLHPGSDGQCLIASSTSATGLVYGSCASGSTGITSLNGLTGTSQTFATGSDANIGLNIVSSGTTHTFTPTFIGQLSVARGGTGTTTPLNSLILPLIANGTVAGVNATSSTVNFLVQGTGTNNPFQVNSSTGTSLLTVLANGNVGLGSSSPTDALDITANNPGTFGIKITNNSTASNGTVQSSIYEYNTSSFGGLFKSGVNYTGYKNIAANDLGFYNSGGNISVLNDAGNINFSAGGSATAQLTIGTNGSTTLSSLGTGCVNSSSGSLFNGANASASNTGCLSSADWTTFNNKLGSYNVTSANGLISVATTTSLATLTASTSPTFTNGAFTGTLAVTGSTTLSSLTSAGNVVTTASGNLYVIGQTGTGLNVLQTSPTLVTPILGVASGTALSLSGSLWTNIQSGTQCIHALASGLLVGTGSDCGSGGSGNSAWTIGNGLIYNATSTDSVLVGTSTPTSSTLFVQGSGTVNPFNVASSSGANLLTINTLGQITATSGTVSLPEYSFSGCASCGMSYPGSGTLDFSSSGSLEFQVGTFGIDPVVSGAAASPSISLFTQSTTGIYWPGGNPNLAITTNGKQRIFFDSQGDTGINSSTPTATLVVQGYSGSTTPTFIVSSSSGTSIFSVSSKSVVGIGTTTASGLLTLQGASGFTNDYLDIASSTGVNAYQVLPSTQSILSVGTSSTASNLIVQGNSSFPTETLFTLASSTGTSLFQVNANGNVGIGSSTPNYGLVANGTVAFPNLTTSSGLQTGVLCSGAGGQIINDSVACLASAKRYKEKINPLTPGLDEIMQLNPVSYYFKPDFNGSLQKNPNYNGLQYGLIADDVQKVDPNLVIVTTATTTFEGKKYAPGTVQGLQSTNTWVGLFVKTFHDLENQITQIIFRQNTQDAKIQAMQAQITKQQQEINLLLKLNEK